MRSCQKAALTGAGALAAAGAGFLFLIAPGRSRRAQRAPFTGQNFAHRGLFDPEKGIPENSLAAFRAAAAAGYGVELDVRLTRDGQVVVSHDNDLARMTGTAVNVDGSTLTELQALRLGGTEETIPLFADALGILAAAKVPVIVEVKEVLRRGELCAKTLDILDCFEGAFCVESFDPFTVRWFRRYAPDLLRGQLTSQYNDLGPRRLASFAVSRVLTNFLCRPQFIAHHTGKKSFAVRVCEALGAMRVRWTAHDRSWEHDSDAVIFERFTPPVRYK